MHITQAGTADFETVKTIVQTTIRTVYPRYYPAGAVAFFCRHHSDERIRGDIDAGKVYLLREDGGAAGTVTIDGNEISRLFVLPPQQHRGYGKALLDFAERMIFAQHDTVQIDASLPAKGIYRKRGYRETAYHMIPTENGDFLCYDVMILQGGSEGTGKRPDGSDAGENSEA